MKQRFGGYQNIGEVLLQVWSLLYMSHWYHCVERLYRYGHCYVCHTDIIVLSDYTGILKWRGHAECSSFIKVFFGCNTFLEFLLLHQALIRWSLLLLFTVNCDVCLVTILMPRLNILMPCLGLYVTASVLLLSWTYCPFHLPRSRCYSHCSI